MNEVRQRFVKGINRVSTRKDSFDPEFFYTLQNARILQDGTYGEVKRIKGYEELTSGITNLDTLYDIKNINSLAFIFYKTTTADQYSVVVIDPSAVTPIQQTFTYTSTISPSKGELKQFDDTIFIAPHNKIIYNFNGTYFIKDFISTIPKISAIDNEDITVAKASFDVVINSTVANYTGEKARGFIYIRNNNIPQGTTEVVNIVFDGVTGTDITLDYTMSREDIVDALVANFNANAGFGDWTASKGNRYNVIIESDNSGTAYNRKPINVIGTDYTRSDDSGGGTTGDDDSGGRNDPDLYRETRFSLLSESNSIDRSRTTFVTTSTQGGTDNKSFNGSMQAVLDGGVKSKSITITGVDTTSSISQKLHDVLAGTDKITKDYDVTVNTTTSTVSITAKNVGTKFNTNLIVQAVGSSSLPDNFYTITNRVEAETARPEGTLAPNTPFWYRARYKYIDGHTTQTCSPKFQVSEGDNRYIDIAFDLTEATDLDDNLPKLQIFRKQEGEDFYLIKEVNLDEETITNDTFVFTDEGFTKKELLKESVNIWTKSHKTQEIVDNRLVKANIDFFDEGYNYVDGDFTLSTVTDDTNDDVAPYNSKLDLYVRPQYTDGTIGYFTDIGRLDVTAKDQKIRIDQNRVIGGTEKDIRELRFYGQYLPYTEEKNLKFTSLEIQTPNLQGIADPDIFPVQTKILYGYKYISVWDNAEFPKPKAYTWVKGWDKQEEEDGYLRYLGEVKETGDTDDGLRLLSDGRLQVNIHGTVKTYIPIAETEPVQDEGVIINQKIYKLEEFDALREAVSTGELYIRLSNTDVSGLSSGSVTDDELLNTRVKVEGLEDLSMSEDSFQFYVAGSKFPYGIGYLEDIKYIYPADDTRIYLLLNDSIFNEIDNGEINHYDFKRRADNTFRTKETQLNLDEPGVLGFDIINFELESPASEDDGDGSFDISIFRNIIDGDEPYKLTTFTEAKYFLINRNINFEDGVIYLGSKDNAGTDASPTNIVLPTTGFKYEYRSSLTYSLMASYNIYETLIFESDFNFSRSKFTNQVIWSSPLVINNYFAGGRNFDSNNFYNIPTENGEILDIISLSGNVYVFCEKGVSRLLIGETLTQQKSGQVYVDSSRFITKDIWILERLSRIDKESIVKHEGSIYFCDGDDVYKISPNGIENITKGVLSLDNTKTYTSTIVPQFNEFRLSNGTETFVYNIKYNVWYGPFTYVPQKTVEIGGDIISWVDTVVKENSTNTFNGVAYDTVIESVANDTRAGNVDKLYRKFYIDTDDTTGVTISYSRDLATSETVNLTTARVRNGDIHVGIASSHQNSKKIYWDLITQQDGFSLKGFDIAYNVRKRR